MTQHQAARKALAIITGLVGKLAQRRPPKFPPYAADGALAEFRLARIHIVKGLAIYDKYQGSQAGPIRAGEDVVEEEAV